VFRTFYLSKSVLKHNVKILYYAKIVVNDSSENMKLFNCMLASYSKLLLFGKPEGKIPTS